MVDYLPSLFFILVGNILADVEISSISNFSVQVGGVLFLSNLLVLDLFLVAIGRLNNICFNKLNILLIGF